MSEFEQIVDQSIRGETIIYRKKHRSFLGWLTETQGGYFSGLVVSASVVWAICMLVDKLWHYHAAERVEAFVMITGVLVGVGGMLVAMENFSIPKHNRDDYGLNRVGVTLLGTAIILVLLGRALGCRWFIA